MDHSALSYSKVSAAASATSSSSPSIQLSIGEDDVGSDNIVNNNDIDNNVNIALLTTSPTNTNGNPNTNLNNNPTVSQSAMTSTSTSSIPPPLIIVHLAIAFAQLLWGAGSVIGHLSLSESRADPILFSAIREGCASCLLTVILYIRRRTRTHITPLPAFPSITSNININPFVSFFSTIKSNPDIRGLLFTGVCLYLGQLGFILGLQLSSSITASSWQPFQALLAIAYEWILARIGGYDIIVTSSKPRVNLRKVIGIIIGIAGALFMVLTPESKQLLNGNDDGNDQQQQQQQQWWTHLCASLFFFINCSASVFYLLISSPISHKFTSLVVTTSAYIVATALMICTWICKHFFHFLYFAISQLAHHMHRMH